MVEESDEQYEKRAKISVAELNAGMKITLNLKKNLKMTKKRSKSDPRKKKQMRILSYTVSGTLYGTVSSIPAMQAIEVPTVQIRQLREKINSQDAKMTLFLQHTSREYKK
jgi:hypothetical protein